MSFAQRLRNLMDEKQMTAYRLSKKINVHQTTISNWIHGKTNPNSETIQKIASALGVSVDYLLLGNEEKDDIKIPGILPLPEMEKLPIIGTIACGIPILAEENIEGYIPAPKEFQADFCLVCKGNSMINARILDGDIVLIRQQPDVDDGEIAAVLIDDEATLKRVYHISGGVTLVAENPAFAPLTFTERDYVNIRILGKAVAFISNVK